MLNNHILDVTALRVNNFNTEKDLELYKAVAYQDIPSVTTLLKEGAHPHAQNKADGTTTIDLSVMALGVYDGNVSYDTLVPESYLNTFQKRFKASLKADNAFQILKLLLPPESLFPNKYYDNRENTLHHPLCQAMQEKWRNNSIELLLTQGVTPLRCTMEDCPGPFYQAIEWNNISVFKLLLDKTQHVDNYKALHRAIVVNNTTMVQLLLEHGYDPHVQTEHGNTAFHTAAYSGNVDIVVSLLNYSADLNVNIRNRAAKSPLHQAVEMLNSLIRWTQYKNDLNKQVKTIILLLQKGMLYNVKDHEGKYATDYLPKEHRDTIQTQYHKLKMIIFVDS